MPLHKDTPISTWISDFIKSDNPKFDGKSKEERKKMAIGAYYAKQRANEAIEEIECDENDLHEAPLELSDSGVSATHIKHIVGHYGKENIHSIRPVAGKHGHYAVFLKDKKNPALLNTRSVKVHDTQGITHTNIASPTTVSSVKHQRVINSSTDYENYNTILEYRIRNAHSEDMKAAFEYGKKAKEEGKVNDPFQSEDIYKLLAKHSDIPQELKIHFANAWKNGYVSSDTVGPDLDDSVICDNVPTLYESNDLTKVLNPFGKSKTTDNKKHFDSLMSVRRIQHVGHLNDDPSLPLKRKEI